MNLRSKYDLPFFYRGRSGNDLCSYTVESRQRTVTVMVVVTVSIVYLGT